ncbi:MAG: hypothetical protein DRP06_01960 [Candidatus Aenigmatarchaeota archaeon]|nr:MAG: hypothetical protein DRP06_01960 [Candidatus Aenigmarchaeota archaeon]
MQKIKTIREDNLNNIKRRLEIIKQLVNGWCDSEKAEPAFNNRYKINEIVNKRKNGITHKFFFILKKDLIKKLNKQKNKILNRDLRFLQIKNIIKKIDFKEGVAYYLVEDWMENITNWIKPKTTYLKTYKLKNGTKKIKNYINQSTFLERKNIFYNFVKDLKLVRTLIIYYWNRKELEKYISRELFKECVEQYLEEYEDFYVSISIINHLICNHLIGIYPLYRFFGSDVREVIEKYKYLVISKNNLEKCIIKDKHKLTSADLVYFRTIDSYIVKQFEYDIATKGIISSTVNYSEFKKMAEKIKEPLKKRF